MQLLSIISRAITLPAAILASARFATANDLQLTISPAPISSNGTVSGADTDFIVTFVDRDPSVPGIDIKTGGTVSLTLPVDFVRDDPGARTRLPILQGWPQSPRVPLPEVSYDADTNTLTGTTTFDFFYVDEESPGPKQFHAILEGFTNPNPGSYPIILTVQPDPDDDTTILTGETMINILPNSRPFLSLTSVINGAPPPPFPNSMYQTITLGEMPLQWGFYIWTYDNVPFLRVELHQRNIKKYSIVDEDGITVGVFRIKAPHGAADYRIEYEASVMASTFGLGLPAGLLKAQFYPDPNVSGDYKISYGMKGKTDKKKGRKGKKKKGKKKRQGKKGTWQGEAVECKTDQFLYVTVQ